MLLKRFLHCQTKGIYYHAEVEVVNYILKIDDIQIP